MNSRISTHRRSGFTLIELLLVIAIIAILAAIVIIAINPARQIGQANDAQRSSNVNTILNAVGQYSIDNHGQVPTTITTSTTPICAEGFTSSTCIDLSALSTNQLYVTALPNDPQSPGTTSTWYTISKSAGSNPRITVNAPNTEVNGTITVTR